MNNLRLHHLLPSRPRTITTTTTALTALTFLTTTTTLLVLGIRDYRAFIALGPGGVPHNALGWAAVTLLIRPFALSKAQATATDDYPQGDEEGMTREGGKAHADVLALPARRGARAEFIRNLFANAALQNPHLLETKKSGYERHNAALFVSAKLLEDAEARKSLPHAAMASSGEIGHPHPDLSIHLYVSPADARVLIEKGWGERHRMSVPAGSLATKVIPIFGRIADTFLMIYGPRDEEEMAVLQTILRNGIRFMTGRDDFEVPEWKVRVGQ
ncbi:hypothetical protein SLS58_011176 [Diplodia intermedia]|uniref:Luciferase domain-containing protein n=1 Tax=Diplodia intermedia TaxID=856260 RepID=A0ABR3T299_9PEZI